MITFVVYYIFCARAIPVDLSISSRLYAKIYKLSKTCVNMLAKSFKKRRERSKISDCNKTSIIE